jgi:hypothetical protein
MIPRGRRKGIIFRASPDLEADCTDHKLNAEVDEIIRRRLGKRDALQNNRPVSRPIISIA